ncbi:MAG: glutathione peroxidase [Acetobacteraceae bacterium]
MAEGAFAFTLPGQSGRDLPLAAFAGRPLLIANTASRCGFTPQYAGLQRLFDLYEERGLVVLGVPSNDFGQQEPGSDAEIAGFCQVNYGVRFPMASKLAVTGSGAHPLFRFLATQGGLLARPRWNFYKYIIGRDGQLAAWFSSLTKPDSGRVRAVVERALG